MNSRKTESKINAKAKFSAIAEVVKQPMRSFANVLAFEPTLAYATVN